RGSGFHTPEAHTPERPGPKEHTGASGETGRRPSRAEPPADEKLADRLGSRDVAGWCEMLVFDEVQTGFSAAKPVEKVEAGNVGAARPVFERDGGAWRRLQPAFAHFIPERFVESERFAIDL